MLAMSVTACRATFSTSRARWTGAITVSDYGATRQHSQKRPDQAVGAAIRAGTHPGCRALHKYNSEGNKIDVIKLFVETEFEGFPVCLHDDMLDDLANIVHPMFFPTFLQVERKAKVESWEHKLSRKMREQGRLIGDKTSHMAR